MIAEYNETFRSAWDRFVMEESCNGTFLQTRNFLEYHPEGKFKDKSLLCLKGSVIIAVVPAHVTEKDGRKEFVSHDGSTFGGIVLGRHAKKIADIEMILEELTEYWETHGYSDITLKMTSGIFCKKEVQILDYFLRHNGFSDMLEMGYCINLQESEDDVEKAFSSSRRRDLKKALQYNPRFSELTTEKEIEVFYGLLMKNMQKFGVKPLHTYEELMDFKNSRLSDIVSFYGIYYEEKMVAGSMVFSFAGSNTFHTQYIVSDQDMLHLFPNEFTYYALIKCAKEKGYRYISFGTATLDHGKILNRSLALFKAGFGTEEYINRTYHKKLTADVKKNG